MSTVPFMKDPRVHFINSLLDILNNLNSKHPLSKFNSAKCLFMDTIELNNLIDDLKSAIMNNNSEKLEDDVIAKQTKETDAVVTPPNRVNEKFVSELLLHPMLENGVYPKYNYSISSVINKDILRGDMVSSLVEAINNIIDRNQKDVYEPGPEPDPNVRIPNTDDITISRNDFLRLLNGVKVYSGALDDLVERFRGEYAA